MKYALTIPASCTWEQWKDLCSQAANIRKAASWAMADLMVYADKHNWLENAFAHLISLGFRRASAHNFLRIGTKFPPNARSYNLSFSHYALAASHDNADQLLERAVKGDAGVSWSFDQFYSHLSAHRAPRENRIVRRLTQPPRRTRYNRPHDDDPLGTFVAMSVRVADSVREMASTLSRQACLLNLIKLDTALRRLLLARNTLAHKANMPSVPAIKDLHETVEIANSQ